MGNEEPLTRWEVRDMIYRAIAEYDVKQDERHKQNSEKLDRNAEATATLQINMMKQMQEIRATISEAMGGRRLLAWGITTLLAVIAIAVELMKRGN